MNKIKAAENVNKGFLNCLPLKANAERLFINLLKIPEVEKSLAAFIINIKSFIENFSTEIVNNIDVDVLALISNNKKQDNYL